MECFKRERVPPGAEYSLQRETRRIHGHAVVARGDSGNLPIESEFFEQPGSTVEEQARKCPPYVSESEESEVYLAGRMDHPQEARSDAD